MTDHKEVRRTLVVATRRLGTLVADPSPAAPVAEAALEAMEGLERILLAHFHAEEGEAGFFEELLRAAPQLSRDVDELRHQHPVLAERIHSIVEGSRWAGLSDSAWRKVSVEFDRFVEEFTLHENTEDRLVAEGLMTDEGGLG